MRLLSFYLFFLCSCQTPPINLKTPLEGQASSVLSPCLSDWNLKKTWHLPGAISHLRADLIGQTVGVVTQPESEIPGSDLRKSHLWILSGEEKVADWEWKQPLKFFEMSASGDRFWVSHPDGRLEIYDRFRSLKKTLEAPCRPWILEKSQQWLCEYEDDAQADRLMDVYDWEGNLQRRWPLPKGFGEVLVFRVSPSEQFLAFLSAGGKGRVCQAPFQSVRACRQKLEVPGEAVQIGWTDSSALAVSFRKGGLSGPPHLAWWSRLGVQPQIFSVPFLATQLVSSGGMLWLSHDLPEEQCLGKWDPLSGQSDFQLLKGTQEARFFQPLKASSRGVQRSVEKPFEGMHLVQIGEWEAASGTCVSSVCVRAAPGAAILDWVRRGNQMWVATDDGRLHWYEKP